MPRSAHLERRLALSPAAQCKGSGILLLIPSSSFVPFEGVQVYLMLMNWNLVLGQNLLNQKFASQMSDDVMMACLCQAEVGGTMVFVASD